MSFWSWIAAIGDTLLQEGPQILMGQLAGPVRQAARTTFAKPVATPKPRIISVDEKQKNMPKEWVGYQHVPRVIVFHDAHRAGPHIETYIEINGQAYNVGVKRLTGKQLNAITYNRKGEISQESRAALIKIVQEEYDGEGKGSFMGQSTDHKPSEARQSWSNFDPRFQVGYGAGRSRTVLADDKVAIWKAGQTIEGRDALLNPHKDFYIHRPFDGVMKVGLKHVPPPKLHDRLHLKPYIGQESWTKFKDRVGPEGTVTIKEDGASFYWHASPHGFHAWSPRVSKTSGTQIDYTHKLGTIRHLKTSQDLTGMGELLIKDKRTGEVLKAHEIGGILNSHDPMPKWAQPKLVLYRIDKAGRKNVTEEPYTENLDRIKAFVKEVGSPHITSPKSIRIERALDAIDDKEGLVGIPQGCPITQGAKFKPRGDEYDWTVEAVELGHGERGGAAGVVWFTNPSGERFKMGAASMGNRATTNDIMQSPEDYIGRVAKVACYQGHEGRAAQFVAWHDSKGLG
jgi:hypothetical protein